MIVRKYKSQIIFFLILTYLIISKNTHYNFYGLIKKPYHERQIWLYGDCDRHGFGFVKKMLIKYQIDENIEVVNGRNYPSISSLFYSPNRKNNNNYKFILHANKEEKELDILENYESCYFVKIR